MRNKRYAQNRRQQQKRRFWQWMRALFLLVFLVAIAAVGVRFAHSLSRRSEERQTAEQLNDITSEAEQANGATVEATQTPSETASLDNPPPVLQEIQDLLQQNSDMVGMLGFDDMALYVCQGGDNFYYASHRFDGSEDVAGMIFMDYRCAIWPMSDNIVLYGHNMEDGSRFGKLHRYTKADFLSEHPLFRFTSLYELREYTPIAVFYASADEDSEHYFDFAQIDFADEAAYQAYIDAVREKSVLNIPAEVQYGDQLLTLVTCDKAYERGRLVIVCKETN